MIMAIGGPDYYQYVTPSRTVLAPGQFRYMGYATEVVSASGGYMELIVSAPEGYLMYLSCIIVSSSKSCIQTAILKKDDVTYGRFDFDISKVIPLPELAAYPITSSESFAIRITNNADEIARVSITILGTFEQVG